MLLDGETVITMDTQRTVFAADAVAIEGDRVRPSGR
jgi:hypothetical protein